MLTETCKLEAAPEMIARTGEASTFWDDQQQNLLVILLPAVAPDSLAPRSSEAVTVERLRSDIRDGIRVDRFRSVRKFDGMTSYRVALYGDRGSSIISDDDEKDVDAFLERLSCAE